MIKLYLSFPSLFFFSSFHILFLAFFSSSCFFDFLSVAAYGVLSFSSKLDEVDVDGRIDRCFARHKTTVGPALYNGENQLERLEAGVPWR